MNYQRIYDAICARGNALRMTPGKKPVGYEDHHIVPRCMDGLDIKTNIARLTLREHFLAHWLLAKMHPSVRGLQLAFWRIANAQGRGRLNSRSYTKLRSWYAEGKRVELTARSQDPDFKACQLVRSRAVMQKLGAHAMSAKAKEALSVLRDCPVYQARYKARHEAAVAQKVCCVETEVVFNSLTAAALWLRTNGKPKAMGNKIGMCCSGKLKAAYGYTWRYA